MKSQIIFLYLLMVGLTSVKAQQIENILKYCKNDKQKIDTLIGLAGSKFMQEDNGGAQICYNYAVKIAHNNADKENLTKIYSFIARLYLGGNEAFKVKIYLDSAQYYFNPQYGYSSLINFYKTKSLYFLDEGLSDSCLHYLFLQEKLNQSYVKPYLNWWVYNMVGNIFYKENKYDLAESYYVKSYEITKTRQSRMDMGLMLHHLAQLYITSNNAYKYSLLQKDIIAFKLAKPKRKLNDAFHSFYLVEDESLDMKQKIEFLLAAKKIHIANKGFEYIHMINAEMSKLYENEKEYTKALDCLLEIDSTINEKTVSLYELYQHKKNLLNIYKLLGNATAATELAQEIVIINERMVEANNVLNTQELESKYQNEKKQLEIAKLNLDNKLKANVIDVLKLQKDYNAKELIQEMQLKNALLAENVLKDSIVQKELMLNEILQNENILKQSELEKELLLKQSLKNESIFKASELERQKKKNWGLWASLLLFSLLSMLIFILYRQQILKNKIIQKQSNDLKVLMKETHHRVKNNLQVVSGLLELQGYSLHDEKSVNAILEGKNRVQSMALIHQNLYQEDNLKGIAVKDYLENLVYAICTSYNLNKNQISIDWDVQNLKLDVDTMIPLGLIINELITNSIKYAFKAVEHREIKIVLKETQNQLHLQVKDNGCGFPEGIDITKSKTFGLKLIRSFAQKLKAQVEIKNDNGAVVDLLISKYKLA